MNNTTSQFMDKQIMDLSNSQTNNNNSNEDFIDFINRPSEDHNRRKDDIIPSYDFMPIRPTGGSTSPRPRSVNFESGNDDGPIRAWNSLDSKSNSSPVRNYASLDGIEPAKVILEKDHRGTDGTLVSEIDRAMKRHTDNLMHAIDGISARLSQLETRTRNIENSVDDLKVTVGNNNGSTDGKLRQVENILREVQNGVQFIKDKQEIVEAHMQIAKLQVPKGEQLVENPNTSHTDSTQPGGSTHHLSHQQLPTVPTQPPPTLSLPNAPPSLPPQQNLPPQVQLPNQYSQNQVPSVPQRDSYFPPPGQAPENPSQQYQTPPVQPQQITTLPPPPLHQQYQQAPQQQYSQQPPPPPQQQYSQQPPTPPHSTIPTVNPSPPQLPLSRHPEEPPYVQSSTYPPSIRPPGPPPSHPSSGASPSQQFYGPPPTMYEPPSSRPNPVYSSSYDPSSAPPGEHYYGGSPSQYSSSSPVKPQHHSSMLGQGGGSGYPQLPTARILPQALPTASGVSSGSGSTGGGGGGNRVPVDDVVDKVTSMGFQRDQVRATVRKLTESGQAVDLNIVLDKLMNDGDVQAPRGGWFGR